MSFLGKLNSRWHSTGSMLCVGLDPDVSRLPGAMSGRVDAIADFCIAIVDATAPYVCAFKPQIAHFAAVGAESQLERVCDHVRASYPDVPLILDAKRGDIGDTAKLYAREAFERYGADAVTVNPYLGTDSLEPFFSWTGRGVIVLCRTSNTGSGTFQSELVDGRPLYEHVAERAAEEWSKMGEVGLVVGATYPDELARVRAIVGDMPLLVPGIGTQGGDAATVLNVGRSSDGFGLIVNSSRAVLYASSGDDFASAAAKAARTTLP
ncbi:MAG: orotidine-5'-phosphate decarboxylase [Actinobacteria bacterium]|nr:orotidine-5'-phosphate decarboxylase [Actinomycetota bacterium]